MKKNKPIIKSAYIVENRSCHNLWVDCQVSSLGVIRIIIDNKTGVKSEEEKHG